MAERIGEFLGASIREFPLNFFLGIQDVWLSLVLSVAPRTMTLRKCVRSVKPLYQTSADINLSSPHLRHMAGRRFRIGSRWAPTRNSSPGSAGFWSVALAFTSSFWATPPKE